MNQPLAISLAQQLVRVSTVNAPVVVPGSGDSGMAHKVDEYVTVEDLSQGIGLYVEILER